MSFKAVLVRKTDAGQTTELETLTDADLSDGDVTITVEYSAINYKYGIAISGRANIIQKFPLVPGIDLAGTVESSSNSDFQLGDRVVIHGWARCASWTLKTCCPPATPKCGEWPKKWVTSVRPNHAGVQENFRCLANDRNAAMTFPYFCLAPV